MKRATLLGIVSLLCVGVMPVASQTIEDRVREVRDGFVRMTFAARDGVCGHGQNILTTGHGNSNWESDCETGPILVSLGRRNSETIDIDTHVGGRWQHRADVTDLGVVSVADAVRFLLTLARTGTSAAEDAILPIALADSVTVWPQLGQMAMNQSVSVKVRKKSLFWMGQLGDNNALDFLVDFIQSEFNNDLREHAVFALSQHDSDWSGTALWNLIEDRTEDISVRKKAVFWAGQRRHDIANLIDLYDQLESRELKEQLIFVYSQRRGDRQAVDKLIHIVREDENRYLQRKAIFWLGQTKHPRAVAFLSELIG